MLEREVLKGKISSLKSRGSDFFEDLSLAVFEYQYHQNPVYQQWCKHLRVEPGSLTSIREIPFLPISFFKNFKVKSGDLRTYSLFESSGTTGSESSKHYVHDMEWYHFVSEKIFEQFFGQLEGYSMLALLPHYLEKGNSSLVEMVNHFMSKSQFPNNGFFLNNWEGLHNQLKENVARQVPTVFWGVTYALMDFSERFPLPLSNSVTIIETGGMKGRKKELIRSEVHKILKERFSVDKIYSEYGMTELLSQAYSIHGNEKFRPGFTMKVLVRELNDPKQVKESGKGLINVIDLANIDSCSFIATDDVGVLQNDGSFEIQGRMDSSDMRGCNLLWV